MGCAPVSGAYIVDCVNLVVKNLFCMHKVTFLSDFDIQLYSYCLISPSADSQPTLKELQALPHSRGNINVIESLAANWKRVAIALSINSYRIAIIDANSSRNVEDACLEMLQWWLDQQQEKKATWRALIRAIQDVAELQVLARDMETALK